MDKDLSRRDWLKAGAIGASAVFLSSLPASKAYSQKTSAKEIYLITNENPYGPSPMARKAMAAAIIEGNRYAYGKTIELEKALAGIHGVTPEHIVLGAGSWEILCQAGVHYGISGGEIVSATPTFDALPRYAALFGAKLVRVPLNEKHEHDLNAMSEKVSSTTKLVYVCNPNNPTGTIVGSAQLRQFCEENTKRTTVMVDEAYIEYIEGKNNLSMVDLVKRGLNIIVLRTFSKMYGMAGMRIGYGVTQPEIAVKLKQYAMSSINVVGLCGAIASLKDTGFLESSKAKNKAAREYFYGELDKFGMAYAESHANFVFAKFGEKNRSLPVRLAEKKVFINRGTPLNGDWARVTIGTMDEMKALSAAMKNSLA